MKNEPNKLFETAVTLQQVALLKSFYIFQLVHVYRVNLKRAIYKAVSNGNIINVLFSFLQWYDDWYFLINIWRNTVKVVSEVIS